MPPAFPGEQRGKATLGVGLSAWMKKMTRAWLSNFGGQRISSQPKQTTRAPGSGTKLQLWNKSGSYYPFFSFQKNWQTNILCLKRTT
jgi:hypothetical protein